LTKSTVIGKAKVISYKDIKGAREKRAVKEAAATLKKQVEKYKSPTPVRGKAKKA